MTENKRYVRILDYSEKEVRIFDEHNQKNIFNIFFEGLDSAICLKGALEDTVDLLNELNNENNHIKQTIQEAYKNERTSIGKSVLKQLLEQKKEQGKLIKDLSVFEKEIIYTLRKMSIEEIFG